MSEKRTILLVEDDRHIALALQIRLGAGGYRVTMAASVAEAVACVDAQVPDVAVIDVNLPDGNGIDLMTSFYHRSLDEPIKPIIMSASRRCGLVEEAMAAGASTFLEKPFASQLLLDAVSTCFSNRQAS